MTSTAGQTGSPRAEADLRPPFSLDFHNPWVDAELSAPRRLPAWAALAASTVVLVVALGLGPRLAAVLPSISAPYGGVGDYALASLLVFGPLLAAALIGGRVEGRAVWRRGPLPGPQGLAGLAAAVLAYGLFALLCLAAGRLGGGGPQSSALAGIALGTPIVAFEAGAEEALFRGWLQPALCARWGPWIGLLATSSLFSAAHAWGAARSPIELLNLVLMGLVLGLLALRSGGLWAPFGFHFGWNWMEECALGLDRNPGVAPGGSLLNVELSGPGLLSGGSAGPNGSLLLTAVAVALIGVLVALRPRRG